MKAYIINLKEAIERRNYMQKQLALLPPSLSSEFIEAVNGKEMNREELEENFDSEKFRLRYAKEVRPGEIGCTLSHQKCYRRLLESKEKCVLILEDDIIVRQNIDFLLPELEKLLITNEPRIVLLSGWYWYLSTKVLKGHYRVANVYDAFLTHAYAINRAAASLIIESRPFIAADDWFYIRKKGVKIYAFLPHLLDQDWSGEYPTSINQEKKNSAKECGRKKMEISLHYFFLKILCFIKRYEKA
ncbi:glycosyltransferase family 25 protein [Bacteroides faecis]|uniref:glycosyltransferase family 25 protein n=1 Tax=Bacteroides faecis TaxID=674529 RepID=UPI00286E0DA1|nr:glycosyltransferase family 25 protein [Bacteroides faecis]MCS2236719.1 glycosyltransferase family 25 protein [Bacteroides faecis]